jgi:hypothetical protein
MGEMERVQVTCTIKQETQRAILIDNGDQECWLPKSVVEVDRLGDESAIVSVPKWLASRKGLI